MDFEQDIVVRVLERPLLRQATTPLALFAGVVVSGIAGFALLAGIGPVESAFWMVDLTSIELHFQGHGGPERLVKVFAILVRVALVLSTLWVGETVLSAAFGGRVQEELRAVRTQRQIEDLEDHVVICGYGIFGRTVASRLRDRGRDVVAIERDQSEFESIDRDRIPAIQGDATREEVLREAGVERASAVVAAIDDSNVNVQIAITASQIAPSVEVVVRVGDESYEALARRAGADRVIVPEVVSGQQVTDELQFRRNPTGGGNESER